MIRRSKTDREGTSATVAVSLWAEEGSCPVAALRRWLERAAIGAGLVFRWIDRHANQGLMLSDRAPEKIGMPHIVHLLISAFDRYRNEASHLDVSLKDSDEALELLLLANHCLRIVERARIGRESWHRLGGSATRGPDGVHDVAQLHGP
jgi:hypothetical protein